MSPFSATIDFAIFANLYYNILQSRCALFLSHLHIICIYLSMLLIYLPCLCSSTFLQVWTGALRSSAHTAEPGHVCFFPYQGPWILGWVLQVEASQECDGSLSVWWGADLWMARQPVLLSSCHPETTWDVKHNKYNQNSNLEDLLLPDTRGLSNSLGICTLQSHLIYNLFLFALDHCYCLNSMSVHCYTLMHPALSNVPVLLLLDAWNTSPPFT